MDTNQIDKQNDIYLEANPNPNSMKFVVNYRLSPTGKAYNFPDIQSASSSPLAKALFNFPYVKNVFFTNNFITITKKEEVEWFEVQEELKKFLKDYLDAGKALVSDDVEAETNVDVEDSEVSQRIIQILEEYVRPAVEQDGGAISLHSFEEGVVKLRLQGACSGCPSSMITLKAGIENLLKRLIPEVKRVEAENM